MRAVTEEDDLKARGDAIYERIYGVPWDSDPNARRPRPIVNVSALALEADLGRDTLYKVMAGKAALKSVQAVESALDDIEQRPSSESLAEPIEVALPRLLREVAALPGGRRLRLEAVVMAHAAQIATRLSRLTDLSGLDPE